MADRYLKLGTEQTYQLKKNIRSSEEDFFNLSQKINAFKILRKKEAILKNRLKVSVSSLKSRINFMISTLPEDERKNVEYKIIQKEREERKLLHPSIERTKPIVHKKPDNPPKDLSQDLEEIRNNLQRFK